MMYVLSSRPSLALVVCWSPTHMPKGVPPASLAQPLTVVIVTAAPIPLTTLPRPKLWEHA